MRKASQYHRGTALAVAVFAAASTLLADSAPQRAPRELSAYIHYECESIFADLLATGDFNEGRRRAQAVLDDAVGFASPKAFAVFREAAFARRFVHQLSDFPDAGDRQELLSFLLEHRRLAEDVAFTFRSSGDEAKEVYATLHELWKTYGDKIAEYPELTAAICVVLERPLVRRVNENSATAPNAVEMFDYFTTNERYMLFGLKNIPPELLVYIVDASAPVPELQWALQNYAGDQAIGKRFFDIAYDHDHINLRTEKRVNVAGWNLLNIRAYGGICADQAHYASTVAKAIGVPSAYFYGRSSSSAHAWVGFVQNCPGGVVWNLDEGRYEDYQGVRGVALDPQIRQQIPDSHIALLAGLPKFDRKDRQAAIAMTDAARRLAEANPGKLQTYWSERKKCMGWQLLRKRNPSDDALILLETALTHCPCYGPGWLYVGKLAKRGCLDLNDKKYWAKAMHRLSAQSYPDFYLDVVGPMIATVENVEEQDRLWHAVFNTVAPRRHDLAAEVRFEQARAWEEAGKPEKACEYYLDTIVRFANTGPAPVAALPRAEKILSDLGRDDEVLGLYQKAFSCVKQPVNPKAPLRQCGNWYRIGSMYAEKLEAAGQNMQATHLRNILERYSTDF